MPLYRYNGKLLVKNGKLAIHERCCCDDVPCCCEGFTGDECITNGFGAPPNMYFAASGQWEYRITNCTLAYGGTCDIVFNLDLEVESQITGQTCNTTATVTLTIDCDHCTDPFYVLVIQPCDGLTFPTGPVKIGGGCDDFDGDGTCGDATGGNFQGVVSGVLANLDNVPITECDVCDESEGEGDGGGGGGGDGGGDGGGGGGGDGGGDPGGGDGGGESPGGGGEGFP